MTYPTAQSSQVLANKLLDALGLKEKGVTEISFRLVANEVATVSVTMVICKNSGIEEVFKQYGLVPLDVPTESGHDVPHEPTFTGDNLSHLAGS